MNDFIIDLVAGVLYSAIVNHEQFHLEFHRTSGPFADAMRQMHWTLHRIESRFTRRVS